MTAKEQAIEAIRQMPPKASLRRIAERLDLLAAIKEAEADIKKGKIYSLEEVRKMIPKWTSQSSSQKARRKT